MNLFKKSNKFSFEYDFTLFKLLEDKFENENFGDGVDFIIEEGRSSIMLSAPHSVKHFRNGKVKISEKRTGLIIILLREVVFSHIIYKTKNRNDDANYDAESDYKNALLNYLNMNEIKCVLDFHISAPLRPFSFDIGTGRGNNIFGRDDLKDIIVSGLTKEYTDVRSDEIFPALNPNTVSGTIAKYIGIPAFQIEINWGVISDYHKVLKFIDCFSNIIKIMEERI